jgi:acylglycerol lipase
MEGEDLEMGGPMNHIEGNFTGVRNINIYYQAWLPAGDAKAVLLITHGLGEHSGRYMNVVNHFVPLGYAVYAYDLIGHGKSGGAREVIDRFEDFSATLTAYYEMVKGWQKGKPIFLLGHSLGGLTAAFYLLDNQSKFRGAIISAPLIKAGENVSRATVIIGRILSVIAPAAGLLPLDANLISKDPEVVKAYVDDPLVFHKKIPARMAAEMLRAMMRVLAEGEMITLPLIALQGSEDKLVDSSSARLLIDKVKSKDKTLQVYKGLEHEVLNEPERARVLKDVETWLKAHV